MLISYKLGQGSIILRVKIRNSSVSTGAGLTGLTYESSGLIISTIADNEATATAYTQAAGNIETIATLGTYAAPTASKCRFREVDATNHPGVYEIQIADARFAVSSAKSVIVSISGATNCAETDCLIPLTSLDMYDGMRAGLTSLANATFNTANGIPAKSALDDAWTTAMTESYAADGDAPTPAQILFMIWSRIAQFAISGVTISSKEIDGSTEAMTFTLDSATAPTSSTRAS